MSRRPRALAFALVVVLVGTALAVGAPATAAEQGTDGEAPPDPDSDEIGWECGYWHNESIDVDHEAGLDEEELDAVVCRSMARVERIRGLEFEEAVEVSVQNRDEFREEVRNRSVDPDLRAFDNAKFEALFLVDQSTDSIEVQDENRGSSVLGYYDPRSDEIVLVAENTSAVRIDEFTLAHELVHALQDQHFNLSENRGETRDEVNARNGLVEGEARYIEYRYREDRCNDPDHAWNGTCLPPPGSDGNGGELAHIGIYFLEYQPYSDGPSFVWNLRSDGGWDAVDAAYDEPPESAEQVIHPEKYPDEDPVNVTIVDRSSDDWERVRPPGRPDYAEVGQTGLASMLVYPTYHSEGRTQIVPPRVWLNFTDSGEISDFDPLNYGFEAAEGWAGDRLYVYRNEANESAYVWRIAWDTPGDAEEFLESYHRVLEYWGGDEIEPGTFAFNDTDYGDAVRVIHENDTVTVVSAPSLDEVNEVRNGSLPSTPAAGNATVEPGETTERPGTVERTETVESTTTLGDPGTDDEPAGGDRTDFDASQPGLGHVTALVALGLAIATLARRRE